MTRPSAGERLLDAVGFEPAASYVWTQRVSDEPLRSADVEAITARVLDGLHAAHVVLPDEGALVRRCVVALLCGHLVLQGPPGTGKTTLARLLADAFDCYLQIATATADWSTYDVIGGLRPSRDGALVSRLGCVSEAALACAAAVRDDRAEKQGEWLLLDELNRADIDKAVGPLYTVLSSVAPEHLAATPLELWFGEGESARLWVPSRFRIIGTMNDIDTSFVNALSQGLARRFQFLYVGVPEAIATPGEVTEALRQAHSWIDVQYPGLAASPAEDIIAATSDCQRLLVGIVDQLRRPADVPGWPLGTAQLVDVWRTVLLQAPDGKPTRASLPELLDEAIADRVVPQMSTLDREQLDAFMVLFGRGSPAMPVSAAAISHLADPHSLP